MKDFVALDFETANWHRTSICSVGIVAVREGAISQTAYSLVRPQPNFYTHWNTGIHGLCFDDTKEAEEFPVIWDQLKEIFRDLPFVAHNSPFDEGCLRATLELYGLPYPGYEFYCTCRAARRKLRGLANHRLPTVAAYLGFPMNNHHHALADAEACALIAIKLFGEE